jgi:hypothetical protein
MADKRVRIIYQAVDNATQVGRQVQQSAKDTQRVLKDVERDAGNMARSMVDGLSGLFGIGGGAMLVGQIARAGWQLSQMGMQVEALERNYRNLSGEGVRSIQTLRDATRGMVSDSQLLQSANQYMAMGLASSSEEAARLIGTFSQLALVMGRDVNGAVAEGAQLLANQSLRRLDQFGISSARVTQRIDELQKAHKDLSDEAAFTQAVLEEAGNVLERVGDQAATGAAGLAQMQSAWQNLQAEAGRSLDASPIIGLLGGQMNEVADVSRFVGDWSRQVTAMRDTGAITRETFTEAMTAANEMGLAYQGGALSAQEYKDALDGLMPSIERFPLILRDGTEAMTNHERQVRDMAARYIELEAAMWGVDGAMNAAVVAKGYAAPMDPWLAFRQQHPDIRPMDASDYEQRDREATQAVLRRMEQTQTDSASIVRQQASELRSIVESVLQPTQVTAQDMADTAAGRYIDKWDEHIRRIRSAASDADSAWKHLIPIDVLQRGEQAVQDWAKQTEEAFYGGQMLDAVNWDTVLADIEKQWRRQQGREALVNEAMRRAQAAGIGVSRSDVSMALGVSDPTASGQDANAAFIKGLTSFDPAEAITVAFGAAFEKQLGQWESYGVLAVASMTKGAKSGAGLMARELAMAVFPFLSLMFAGQGPRP